MINKNEKEKQMKSDVLAYDVDWIRVGAKVWLYDVRDLMQSEDGNVCGVVQRIIENEHPEQQFGRVLMVKFKNGTHEVISQAYVFESKEDLLYARTKRVIRKKGDEDATLLWADEVPEGYEEIEWPGYNERKKV